MKILSFILVKKQSMALDMHIYVLFLHINESIAFFTISSTTHPVHKGLFHVYIPSLAINPSSLLV